MTLMRISLILLVIHLGVSGITAESRYFVKVSTADRPVNKYNDNYHDKSRAIYRLDNNDESMIRETLKANTDKRNSFIESSTFDPDILNKFLDEYASKIKTSTETNHDKIQSSIVSSLDIVNKDDAGEKISTTSTSTKNIVSENNDLSSVEGQQVLNDTVKRNKFYNPPSEDKNGWVTLEAVPWSKSKISKWQANPSSHRPWPETTKWDKPGGAKPWQSDYPSRPQYQNDKPWYDKPKPQQWPDYDQERPKPQSPPNRPSYFSDRYDTSPSQAQKWPPERPNSAWEDFPESYRPTSDIITDNRPSNFPTNNWNKYDQPSKPSYPSSSSSSFYDRYQDESSNDWPTNNYQNRFEQKKEKPSFSKPSNRPFYSNYDYESHHPPSHPSNGDGEWVLLSTNRGYSKSRQRSVQFDGDNNNNNDDNNDKYKIMNLTSFKKNGKIDDDSEPARPVMTSKRQVRLTVLPSINGTNTTTSHGGLLEVEETFKTVDQSQREYEAAEKLKKSPTTTTSSSSSMIIKKRPIKSGIIIQNKPSNSAVLAAVGAGMLPATMAMVIPMMLGRKKRSIDVNFNENYQVKYRR